MDGGTLDAGIRGTMVDFGDIIPDEAVFSDEQDLSDLEPRGY